MSCYHYINVKPKKFVMILKVTQGHQLLSQSIRRYMIDFLLVVCTLYSVVI